MVSLWPWKVLLGLSSFSPQCMSSHVDTFVPRQGSGTSPAEFEKTLSTLSAKIARATTRLDGYRQRSRRYRVLWTLYTSFAYLLYSIIVTLVLGWQNWGPCEYSTVAGGPVLCVLF